MAAVKALVDAIIESAERTGALDEKLMAELPPTLAEQFRAGWPAQQYG